MYFSGGSVIGVLLLTSLFNRLSVYVAIQVNERHKNPTHKLTIIFLYINFLDLLVTDRRVTLYHHRRGPPTFSPKGCNDETFTGRFSPFSVGPSGSVIGCPLRSQSFPVKGMGMRT